MAQDEYDMKALLSEVLMGNNKVISVSNPEKFKALFYKARKALQAEGLPCNISCRTSPDNPQGEVWLVKGPND